MICLVCKKQIPDQSETCPNCGYSIDQQKQMVQEIKIRRYQRWAFYILMSLLFIGMTVVMIRIYGSNTKLVNDMVQAQTALDDSKKKLAAKDNEIGEVRNNLSTVNKNFEASNGKATEAEKNLKKKEDELKNMLQDRTMIDSRYKQCSLDLDLSDSNIYSLIIRLGKAMSNKDLAKIQIADDNLAGNDADSDGLSDIIEIAIGADKNKADTDGDGYGDKNELLQGFDPLKKGSRLPVNTAFSNYYKGSILLQVESRGEAWYVAGDGKRYFLGIPGDAFKVMRNVEYWTKGWKKEVVEPVSIKTASSTPTLPKTSTSTPPVSASTTTSRINPNTNMVSGFK